MLRELETTRLAWTRLSRSLTEKRKYGKRTCSHCKRLLMPDEFYRTKKQSSWCKQCRNESKRAWRVANRERERQVDRQRRRRAGSPPARVWTQESVLAAFRAFYEENGHQPVSDEAGPAHGLPAYGSVVRLFGSWNAAIEACGWRPYPSQSSVQAKTMVGTGGSHEQ